MSGSNKGQRLTLTLHSGPGGEGALSPALRRACDRCRRRKTRCDGRDGCRACVKAGVECSYLAVPKPLGRKPRKQQQKSGKAGTGSENSEDGGSVLDEVSVGGSVQEGRGLVSPAVDVWTPCVDLTSEMDLPFDAFLDSLTPPQDMSPQLQEPLYPVLEVGADWAVPATTFTPYLSLFFARLYPVFPILDHNALVLDDNTTLSWPQYTLLSSLAAAVTVQLNLTIVPAHDPEFWISQTLRAREQWDFTSDADESTIVTSFFLFAYYGNRNRSSRAWYHLREAIGFALAAGLDDAERYAGLEGRVGQRRCRLFWLLYITERAYALQHKTTAMLRPTIDLPRIFESDDPKLIYGFVSLVTLFQSVDDRFLSMWKGGPAPVPRLNGKSHPEGGKRRTVDGGTSEMVEVQRLDVTITQKWLYLLAWQLQARGPERSLVVNKGVPFTVSRETLRIVTSADRASLECHGIGMEQKMFDIACCLSDVLRCSPGLAPDAVSAGHAYLHGFMTVLATFRNRESEYLQPLLARASTTLAAELSVPALLTAAQPEAEEVWENESHGEGSIDLYRSCSA